MVMLLSKAEVAQDMTSSINQYLNYLSTLIGSNGFIQVQIDRLLNDAAKRCPHNPAFDKSYSTTQYKTFEIMKEDEKFPVILIVAAAAASIGIMLALLVLALRCFVHRRHRKCFRTFPSQQVLRMKRQQETELRKESDLNDATNAMFASEHVPLLVRIIMPFIILGNVALFLSGHLDLAASVDIEASFAGQTVNASNFYEFSMLQSTLEIWEAGGKELAVLIFIFSGVWPYTKQLITLILWFSPTNICSISLRGSILAWLDTLAKWSMIDIFVTVVSVAGFRVSILSPEVSFLPQDFYSIDLMVVPLWGLYANMAAQLISQISSHVIIHYHRRIVNQGMKEYVGTHRLLVLASMSSRPALDGATGDYPSELQWNPDDPEEDQLCKHAFSRPHRGEYDKLIVRRYVNSALVLGALALCILILAGCTMPSLTLEFFGLVGIAIESGQRFDEAIHHYNMFGITGLLMDQANFLGTMEDKVGLGSLSALLVVTVLFVPLLQTVTLLVHWFCPMTGKSRRRLSVFVEILQAWQYAEVYIIALFVASWYVSWALQVFRSRLFFSHFARSSFPCRQLGPISEWMVNAYCTGLNDIFSDMVYYGFISANDGQCFQVHATVTLAAYFLAGGAVLLALLNTYVMKATEQYFRDSEIERERLISMHRRKQEGNWTRTLGGKDASLADSCTLRLVDGDDPCTDSCDGNEVASATVTAENLSWDEADNRAEAEKRIHPVPVLFTDRFRWTLWREIPAVGRSRQQLGNISDSIPMLLSNGEPLANHRERVISNDAPLVGVEIRDEGSVAVSCIVDEDESVAQSCYGMKNNFEKTDVNLEESTAQSGDEKTDNFHGKPVVDPQEEGVQAESEEREGNDLVSNDRSENRNEPSVSIELEGSESPPPSVCRETTALLDGEATTPEVKQEQDGNDPLDATGWNIVSDENL